MSDWEDDVPTKQSPPKRTSTHVGGRRGNVHFGTRPARYERTDGREGRAPAEGGRGLSFQRSRVSALETTRPPLVFTVERPATGRIIGNLQPP